MPERALASVTAQQAKASRLSQPHIVRLEEYRETVGRRVSKDLPRFDPDDGGTHARIAFVLESPGPKAVDTAFISRENPDFSATYMRRFLEDAEIARKDTLLWNIVPWYLGKGDAAKPTKAERDQGYALLVELLDLLPRLQVVVLVGGVSQGTAKSRLESTGKYVVTTAYHPSPRVCNSPSRRRVAQLHYRAAAALLYGRGVDWILDREDIAGAQTKTA
ncbi:MAG: uracil-DNA glycosylase [Planctomycetota bacterium]